MVNISDKYVEIDKMEAISKYGTDSMLRYYTKYKKIDKNNESALIKTLESYYEIVEKVKRGRAFVYRLHGLRDNPMEREDGRVSNGTRTIEYAKNMDIIVVSSLEQRLVSQEAQTIRKWLFDFGLISSDMLNVLGINYSKMEEEIQMAKLLSDGVLKSESERQLLFDYVNYSLELQGQLKTTLERMKKANIIEFYERKKVKIYQSNEVIDADSVLYDNILRKRREIMATHGLTGWEVQTLKFKKEVVDFNKEFSRYLHSGVIDKDGKLIKIDYYWDAYSIHLRATDRKIKTFLKKYNSAALKLYLENEDIFLKGHYDAYAKNRMDYLGDIAIKKVTQNSSIMKNAIQIFGSEINSSWMELYLNRIFELQQYYGKVTEWDSLKK